MALDQQERWSVVFRVPAGFNHPVRDEVSRGPKPMSLYSGLTRTIAGGLPVPMMRRSAAQRSEKTYLLRIAIAGVPSQAIWSTSHLNWTNPRARLTQSGPHGAAALFAVSRSGETGHTVAWLAAALPVAGLLAGVPTPATRRRPPRRRAR
jgi:hypothetical protein